jgi:hypothetical protein
MAVKVRQALERHLYKSPKGLYKSPKVLVYGCFGCKRPIFCTLLVRQNDGRLYLCTHLKELSDNFKKE